ncbi:1-phosphofructokinase family hexose kinase [Corynebacterium uberis]|uniref:1-phosphofructokinase family hexose kinase n=1 Tax=Corynebacterium TaxID=1716 RepID=UPI001D0A7AEF|nr:1-phosphofructokinase family hexose kinase [Corynebacterium uberis]MCZ9308496.1 1-phosphofructokinase family hexose kinase [Corynebacterium sp. c6VSa_13]UDL74155.1 1-phosphofructokinase family hexose kinase [Corynebacterium uberis]UDL74962.1 1-phosphofructokinase family hexose kinase [Corynebacterium uberis]UDL79459.1 1-phosphofructokinase family hexose kinase [Corynebacterium uberis]UDL81591.1 1-phosphofructokinase family hexose kinase [Corynebacterium uberis]
MILTFTPNPSVDATLSLDQPLAPGQVHRLRSVTRVAGGKGINVSHATALAGHPTVAVFPAADHDPFLALAEEAMIPTHPVTMDGVIRMNTTVTEPDGTTTKLNGPGPHVSAELQATLERTLIDVATRTDAQWIVLAGSLPPGPDAQWYAHLVAQLRAQCPALRIAVDTSDAPMIELGRHFEHAAPHLIKPNGLELGQLVGADGQGLEDAAAAGDFQPVVAAARTAVERGVETVLVTLGGAGAVLVTAEGAWKATPPPIEVVSTVGAGDSSLTGYLLAQIAGAEPAERLRNAVAYGSAATALPGTTLPRPEQLDHARTTVTALS